jgi:NLR family CARD domain-containing protein 3
VLCFSFTLARSENNSVGSFICLYRLGNRGAILLAKELRTNVMLITLHLSHNDIGRSGAMALGDALATNTTLTTLSLTNNQIEGKGAAAVAKSLLTNSVLTVV